MKFSVFRLYRAKRFRLLAFIKHWQRSVAVLGTLVSLLIAATPFDFWVRLVYLLIAVGYLWGDAYFTGKSFERKYRLGQAQRERRKALHQATSMRP